MSKSAQRTAPAPAETLAANPARTSHPQKVKNAKPTPANNAALVKGPDKPSLTTVQSQKLAELAEGIRASHRSIGALSKTAREKIAETMAEVLRCGEMLSECKVLVGHGGWLKWLGENCKMSIGTAQAYMRVSAAARSNNQRADYLEEPKSIRQAIALLSDGRKKSPPKSAKGDPTPGGGGGDLVRRVSWLAERLTATLGRLPRGQQNEAFEALSAVRQWINSASIPVPLVLGVKDAI